MDSPAATPDGRNPEETTMAVMRSACRKVGLSLAITRWTLRQPRPR